MDPPGPERVPGLPERGHHPGLALLPQGHQPPSWHKDQPERHPVPERAQRPAREPGPHRESGQEQHPAREPGPHPGLAQEPASWHKDQRVPGHRPELGPVQGRLPASEPVRVRLRERALGLAPPREPELRQVQARYLRPQAY